MSENIFRKPGIIFEGEEKMKEDIKLFFFSFRLAGALSNTYEKGTCFLCKVTQPEQKGDDF